MVHTIQKDVSPEHIEEIRIANQSSEVSTWTVEDIETYLAKKEEEAGFHVQGNALAADKAWAFVLFPENQERDQDKYPVNFEHEHVVERKKQYINNFRILLSRIDVLGANKTPSTDINKDEFTLEYRARRLIEDRKDMSDACHRQHRHEPEGGRNHNAVPKGSAVPLVRGGEARLPALP